MREFIYGSSLKFSNLWNQLIDGSPKRIKFNVNIPTTTQQAKLIFATAGVSMVSIFLNTNGLNQSEYGGQSETLKDLLSGRTIYCNSPAELKMLFSSMQIDYTDDIDIHEAEPQLEERSRSILPTKFIDPVELANNVKKNIIGQDLQIEEMAISISNHLRKTNPNKPLTIMLPGPTGTGKTATAKEFAKVLQDIYGKDSLPIIVINCNEYKEEYRISQLLGSPAGYVGYGDECVMEPIKYSDCAIIVFDEYEKAHNSIHTAVMNWMDTGIINLSKSTENNTSGYDCKKSIIIMTSNIDMSGANFSSKSLCFKINNTPTLNHHNIRHSNDACRQIMVANGFKPEIASRIGYFFEYKQLTEDDVFKIMILTIKNKALEYGCKISNIGNQLLDDIRIKYKVSQFGVRSLESDLDRILGSQIPVNLDTNFKYDINGHLNDIQFVRR